jgi:epoxide hydrolase-like predicted phosphatase
MIRAIVFDIGGVLLRTEDRTFRQELANKYSLQASALESLVFDSKAASASTIGQVSEAAVWRNVAKNLAISPQALEKFKISFWAGDQLDRDLIMFLKAIRPKYTTALLSNAWKGARAQLAEKCGIKEGETVDHILISSELGVAKPDPQIYEILAETVNCQFNEIIFVDDFIENIIAAKDLGIWAIHYQPGEKLIPKIEGILNLN